MNNGILSTKEEINKAARAKYKKNITNMSKDKPQPNDILLGNDIYRLKPNSNHILMINRRYINVSSVKSYTINIMEEIVLIAQKASKLPRAIRNEVIWAFQNRYTKLNNND